MLPPLSGEQKMWYILKGYTINVDVFGSREWYLNDQLHREDGPAIEYAPGSREWFLNGHLHREGGPAVEWENGNRTWYLDGIRISKKNRQLTQKKMANIG
jgi:hypothetical protein